MNLKKLSKIKLFLLFLTLITLPFGYLSRVNLGEVFIGLYYWDLLILLYITSFIFSIGDYWKVIKVSKFPSFYILVVVFILYAVVITLNSYRYIDSFPELAISSLYLLRWSIYSIAGIALYFDIRTHVIEPNILKKFLIYEGILISVIGFVQLIVLPDFTMLDESLMWDPHQNRLSGLYFDPNFAGIILALSLSVLVSEILNIVESKKHKSRLPLLFSFFLLISVAIIFTFSRSAWLAVAVMIFVLGVFKYRWVIPISLVVVFLVYYAVPRVQTRISGVTDPSDSFYFRFESWNETYQIGKTNPLFGYGFNTLRYIKSEKGLIEYNEGRGDRSDAGSDSSLLFVWVTTGLIGLTIFIIAHTKLVFLALNRARSNNFALVYSAFLFGLFVNSQFINSLFFPALAVNLSVFTAILFSEAD